MTDSKSSAAAIEAEALSKEYQLGGSQWGQRSLYDVLAESIGLGRAQRGRAGARQRFLALDDVSFRVTPGEVVGVVGRNGAGKSTLLKILARITTPTSGRAVLRGNLASLLEVGTGFHPELSGRENVYLNGTILGMSRREIERKFDDIVEFAEISQFLDTPVKRYSSGMYVRLAFAVAAHLDADILLVDEVLAVGDAGFQRKSLGKMENVAQGGRTVVFVSHNLAAVRSLCRSLIYLEKGRVRFRGAVAEGLALYETSEVSAAEALSPWSFSGPLLDRIAFSHLAIEQDGSPVAIVDPTRACRISLFGKAERSFSALNVNIVVSRSGFRLFSCHDAPLGSPMREGSFESSFEIAAGTLRPGRYTVGVGAATPDLSDWLWGADVGVVEVQERWTAAGEAFDREAVGISYQGTRIHATP